MVDRGPWTKGHRRRAHVSDVSERSPKTEDGGLSDIRILLSLH